MFCIQVTFEVGAQASIHYEVPFFCSSVMRVHSFYCGAYFNIVLTVIFSFLSKNLSMFAFNLRYIVTYIPCKRILLIINKSKYGLVPSFYTPM